MTDDVFERIDLDKATEAFKKSSFNETTRTNVKIGEKFISFAKHHIIHKDLLLKEENIFSKLATTINPDTKKAYLDFKDFNTNGVHLAVTEDGADITGTSRHAGSHKLYRDFFEGELSIKLEQSYNASLNVMMNANDSNGNRKYTDFEAQKLAYSETANKALGIQNYFKDALINGVNVNGQHIPLTAIDPHTPIPTEMKEFWENLKFSDIESSSQYQLGLDGKFVSGTAKTGSIFYSKLYDPTVDLSLEERVNLVTDFNTQLDNALETGQDLNQYANDFKSNSVLSNIADKDFVKPASDFTKFLSQVVLGSATFSFAVSVLPKGLFAAEVVNYINTQEQASQLEANGDFYAAGKLLTKYYFSLGAGELLGAAGFKVGAAGGWGTAITFAGAGGLLGALGGEKLGVYLYEQNPAYFSSLVLNGLKEDINDINGWIYSGDDSSQPGYWYQYTNRKEGTIALATDEEAAVLNELRTERISLNEEINIRLEEYHARLVQYDTSKIGDWIYNGPDNSWYKVINQKDGIITHADDELNQELHALREERLAHNQAVENEIEQYREKVDINNIDRWSYDETTDRWTRVEIGSQGAFEVAGASKKIELDAIRQERIDINNAIEFREYFGNNPAANYSITSLNSPQLGEGAPSNIRMVMFDEYGFVLDADQLSSVDWTQEIDWDNLNGFDLIKKSDLLSTTEIVSHLEASGYVFEPETPPDVTIIPNDEGLPSMFMLRDSEGNLVIDNLPSNDGTVVDPAFSGPINFQTLTQHTDGTSHSEMVYYDPEKNIFVSNTTNVNSGETSTKVAVISDGFNVVDFEFPNGVGSLDTITDFSQLYAHGSLDDGKAWASIDGLFFNYEPQTNGDIDWTRIDTFQAYNLRDDINALNIGVNSTPGTIIVPDVHGIPSLFLYQDQNGDYQFYDSPSSSNPVIPNIAQGTAVDNFDYSKPIGFQTPITSDNGPAYENVSIDFDNLTIVKTTPLTNELSSVQFIEGGTDSLRTVPGIVLNNDTDAQSALHGKSVFDTLKATGVSDADHRLIGYGEGSGGQAFNAVKQGATFTHADGTETSLVDYANQVSDGASVLVNNIGEELGKVPQYLNALAPGIISDLVRGDDIEEVAERYAIQLGVTIGVDVLLDTFGDLAAGTTNTNDPNFFDSGAGAFLKGAIIQFAVVAALRGEDMEGSDYAKLIANYSIRSALTEVVKSTSWGSMQVPLQQSNFLSDFFTGTSSTTSNGTGATGTGLSPAGAGAVAAAVTFFANLIDHGFEDFEQTLVQTAVAGATAYLGAALAVTLGPLGYVIGAVLGNLLGSLFGPGLPPPPPLFRVEENGDGSQTVYITAVTGGYVYEARDGFNDVLVGNHGQDNLIGSDGDNELFGNANKDILNGHAGDDLLSAGKGDDIAIGGLGEDVILGGSGNDNLFGDQSIVKGEEGAAVNNAAEGQDDQLIAGDGDDYAFGGAGNDYISGGNGDDTLFGGAGNDTVSGDDGDDLLNGGIGDDTIYGDTLDINDETQIIETIGAGNDVIDAGDGDDTVYGGEGDDQILGGLGADRIYGDGIRVDQSDADNVISTLIGSGTDTIDGGAGNDIIYGGAGADTIIGGTGDDFIEGNEGNDQIEGGAGDDILGGNEGDDTLDGGDGNDQLTGNDGVDLLFGGAGSDSLDGGLGNDHLDGGADNDLLRGDLGDDTILGGDGDDLAFGGIGNDTLDGGAGNDTILGEIGDDTLSGGAGDDTLSGGSQNDILDGGLGDDLLQGGSGNDTLVALAGSDRLEGGSENDTYIVKLSAGETTIFDVSGADMLELSGDIKPKDIILSVDGADLIVGLRSDDTKTIRVLGQFDANSDIMLEAIKFTDGFTINISQMIIGDDGDNNLNGTDMDDGILGLGGNDNILGQGGDDFLDGGAGEDIIYGGAGNDQIHGSSEDDLLSGDQGDDTLIDGAGNDLLIGGQGNDVFVIGNHENSDQDTIADFTKGEDRIDFSGFGRQFVTRKQMDYFGSRINQTALMTSIALGAAQLLKIEGLDASTLDDSDFIFDQQVVEGVSGSDGNDIITGTDADETILDGKGFDVLTGGLGKDHFTISAQQGDIDTITDFTVGEDKIDLKQVTQFISANHIQLEQRNNDVIIHLENDQYVIVDNTTINQLTDDQFDFDVFENQTNVGRYTGDVDYDFTQDDIVEDNSAELSDGVNSLESFISDLSANWDAQSIASSAPDESSISSNAQGDFQGAGYFATSSNIDSEGARRTLTNNEYWVKFGSWYQGNERWELARDVNFHADNNAIVNLPNNEIYNYLSSNIVNSGYYIQPDAEIGGPATFNYTYWSLVSVQVDPELDIRTQTYNYSQNGLTFFRSNQIGYGASSYETFWFSDINPNDLMNGGYWGENIQGNHGNDRIFGNNGHDQIYGGSGNDDLYGGTGDDHIYGQAGNDQLQADDGNDLLDGGSGNDVLRGGTGNNTLNGGADNDYLAGYAGDDIADGGTGDDYILGGDGNDTLRGGAGKDIIYGEAGDDRLEGGESEDYLSGGAGSDTLLGDSGADILVGGEGDDNLDGGTGNDQLFAGDGNNALSGGDGDDYLQAGNGQNRFFGNAGNDKIVLGSGDDYAEGGAGNDLITAVSGKNWIHGGAGIDAIYGGNLHDTIFGGSGSDFIDGGEGSDFIKGGTNDDLILGGEGHDHIEGGQGDDLLKGDAGSDLIIGGAGSDRLEGGTGNDFLRGDDLNADPLNAVSSNDTLLGGDGNDTLEGGIGNDILTGGAGSDTFVFNTTWHEDTITDFENNGPSRDLIDFSNRSDVQNYSDLVISYHDGYALISSDFGQIRLEGVISGLSETDFRFGQSISNIAPVATIDKTISATEDTTLTINTNSLLENDFDVDGDTFSLHQVGKAAHGTVEINNEGNIIFVPENNYAGLASFEYVIIDNLGAKSSNTVSISLTGTQDAVSLANSLENQVVDEDISWNFTIPENTFLDLDGDTLSYSVTLVDDTPLPIWLSFDNQTRVLSGTPPQDFNGSIEFKVKAADANSEAIDEFTLEVLPVNDAPIALGDDGFETNEDTSITLLASDLIGNDSDVDGDDLTIVSVSDALNGSVALDQNGAMVFTPAANYYGTASFRYTLSDGNGGTSLATVTLVVNAVNDAVIIGQSIADQTIDEDTAWNFTLPTDGLVDVDGDATYSASLADDSPLPSWITFDAGTQSFSGMPPQDFNGIFNIKVSASDASLQVSDVFTFTIAPVNDAPIAVVDFDLDVTQNEATTISKESLLLNDSDADGDLLIITSVQDAINGSVTMNENGDVIFSPSPNYNGTAMFSYTISDGNGSEVTATANLIVSPNVEFEDKTLVERYLGVVEYNFVQDSTVENNSSKLPQGTNSLETYSNQLIATMNDFEVNDSPITNGAPDDTTGHTTPEDYTDLSVENNYIHGGFWNQYIVGPDGTQLSIEIVNEADNVSTANDYFLGTIGNNTYNGGNGDDYILGGDGNDTLSGSYGDDVLYGENGIDTISGNYGDDYISGGTGNDKIHGGYGNDKIYGGEGNDKLEGFDGNDIIYGEEGDDTINGNKQDDYISGGAGNDKINGGNNNDIIYGDLGDDYLEGHVGNDFISGGDGDDFIQGGYTNANMAAGIDDDYVLAGNGDDTVRGYGGNDIIYGQEGNDTLSGNYGDDYLSGGVGADTIDGGYGNDYILGGAGDDHLEGFDGNDIIYGQDGNDYIESNKYDDFVDGGAGNDTIKGGSGGDTLFGGDDDDLILGEAGNDIIDGGDGNDIINGGTYSDLLFGGFGNDNIRGDTGNDKLYGGDGDDELIGDTGNDIIKGQNGNDFIDGGSYSDLLDGGSGDDIILGGTGDDKLIAGDGDDYIEAGSGNDLIYGTSGNNWLHGGAGIDAIYGGNLHDSIFGGSGSDLIDGGDGSDLISGGTNDDLILGGTGHDDISGDQGNDVLNGNEGDDIIDGGDGNDLIAGGSGNDLLTGGLGNDTFIFNLNWGHDTITDFQFDSDAIDFSNNTEIVKFDDLTISYSGGNGFVSVGEDVIKIENLNGILETDDFKFVE